MEKQKLNEHELELAFEKELIDKGYPVSRIVREFGKIPYGIVDVAIVDVDYTTPIAFYEVKSRTGVRNYLVHKGLSALIKFFQKMCNLYGMIVPCYLVYKDADDKNFSVVDLTKFVGGEIVPEYINHGDALFDEAGELPIYRYNASGQAKLAIKKAEAKQRRIDLIKLMCWLIFPLIGIGLLVLDALEIYTFTPMRLVVMGVLVLLALIPFFSEISIKDISLKRHNEKKEKDNEDDQNV